MRTEDKTKKQLIAELEEQAKALEDARIALEESENKYRSAIDAQNDGIVFQLADGSIEACNKSSERILGLSADQMMGRTSLDPRWRSIHEDGSPFPGETHPTAHALRTGESTADVIMGIHQPSGELRWISISCNPLFRAGESLPYAAVASFRDITEKKQMQQHLLQAQKSESIGILAGGIAHELNNVLLPILGYSEMLEKTCSGKSKIFAQNIRKAAERGKSVVSKVLSFSRKSTAKRESVQPESVVEEVIELLARTLPATISVQKAFAPNVCQIMAAYHEIYQVVLNLCLNATHVMPEGGELTISAKNGTEEKCRDFFGKAIDEPYVVISVTDTGHGIDEDIIPLIFDPFYTTKEPGEGTGMGLSVALGIVEQHGGHIHVNTEPGVGTRFDICIPSSNTTDNNVTEAESPSIALGEEHILLIDDDGLVLELTSEMLIQLGYRVTSFMDPGEALKWFDRHINDVDLVISDYRMPKITGVQFAEQAKLLRPDIPIILSTGYDDTANEERNKLPGIDAILNKPYKLRELSQVLRRFLGISTAHS